jgi:hypothetical protein
MTKTIIFKESFMDTPPTFHVGDLVVIADGYAPAVLQGVAYRVVRRLQVNVELEPLAGGRRVRVNPRILLPAPPGTDPITTPAAIVDYQPPLTPGQIVTVAGPGWRRPATELFVVMKEKPDMRVSIAKLGGDEEGRYWPNVPRSIITVVDADQVIKTTGTL